MNLVIDWGNTRLKTGWFEGLQLVDRQQYTNVEGLLNALQRRAPDHIIVASTSASTTSIQAQLALQGARVLLFSNLTPVPIRNAYASPATLGADRLAAAVGAATLFPDSDSLVLDLGTCLTVDLVDRSGTFLGGLIAPGMHMRFRAMHEQTARLPLVDVPTDGKWPALTATNTTNALQSGVLNGMLHELNGIIDTYRAERPDIRVLLCGGDAGTFESRLKPPIFVNPDLVLTGLNRILAYNVDTQN